MARILIVEDNPAVRKMLRWTLEERGIEVIEAPDGLEALSIIFKDTPQLDLIILDMLMPNLNGLEFLTSLRNKPKLRHIPVLVCTSVADKSTVAKIIQSGADDYLIKPVARSVFLKKIFSIIHDLEDLEESKV